MRRPRGQESRSGVQPAPSITSTITCAPPGGGVCRGCCLVLRARSKRSPNAYARRLRKSIPIGALQKHNLSINKLPTALPSLFPRVHHRHMMSFFPRYHGTQASRCKPPADVCPSTLALEVCYRAPDILIRDHSSCHLANPVPKLERGASI